MVRVKRHISQTSSSDNTIMNLNDLSDTYMNKFTNMHNSFVPNYWAVGVSISIFLKQPVGRDSMISRTLSTSASNSLISSL